MLVITATFAGDARAKDLFLMSSNCTLSLQGDLCGMGWIAWCYSDRMGIYLLS